MQFILNLQTQEELWVMKERNFLQMHKIYPRKEKIKILDNPNPSPTMTKKVMCASRDKIQITNEI